METRTELQRLFVEPVPFRIGSRVKINPAYRHASEWRGVFIVTGMRWEYQRGSEVNIEITDEDSVIRGHGSTDGFRPADLLPA